MFLEWNNLRQMKSEMPTFSRRAQEDSPKMVDGSSQGLDTTFVMNEISSLWWDLCMTTKYLLFGLAFVRCFYAYSTISALVCLAALFAAIILAQIVSHFKTIVLSNIAFFPGLCYLHLFPGRELDALRRHGFSPLWRNVVNDSQRDDNIRVKFKVVSSTSKLMHICPAVDSDLAVSNMDVKFHDYCCGDEDGSLGQFLVIQGVAQVSQMMHLYVLCMIVFHIEIFASLLAFLVLLLLKRMKISNEIAALAAAFSALFTANVTSLVLWYMSNVAVRYVIEFMYITWWSAKWWRLDPIPGPTGPVHEIKGVKSKKFSYHNRNYHIDKLVSTESTAMVDQASLSFRNETGVTDARVTTTPKRGVLGKEANKHAILKLEQNYLDGEYTILIGDTFEKYSNNVSGVAFQPEIVMGDSHKLIKGVSKPGLGQQIAKARVDTTCLAVGSRKEEWNPYWSDIDLTGAIMVSNDPYTIPIKSILGIATMNNTHTVCVTIAAFPDMFLQVQGYFPWTEKNYKRERSIIKIYKNDDADDPIITKTRIIYEHLFTTYVQTAPGIYYVSNISDRVFDVHTIVWRRTTSKPLTSKTRMFEIDKLGEITTISCMVKPGTLKFRRLRIHEQYKGYLRGATKLDEIKDNFRALTDSLNRNTSETLKYWDSTTIDGLWEAELWRRKFSEQAVGYTHPATWTEVIGLHPGESLNRTINKMSLDMLVREPKERYEFRTLTQDDSYIKLKISKSFKNRREYPYPPEEIPPGGMYPQSRLDRMTVSKIVEYKKFSKTMIDVGAQMCMALFYKTENIQPILPIGENFRGGSRLSKQGNKLLPSEIEHLIVYGALTLIVNDNGDFKFYNGMQLDDDRKIVIKWDKVEQRISRVHYPEGMKISEIFDYYDCRNDDLTNIEQDILQMTGTKREYEPAIDVANKAQKHRHQALIDKGQLSGISQSDLARSNQLEYPFTPMVINRGMTWSDLNRDVSCFECRAYDGDNVINGTFVPAHYYWDWSLDEIRKLRKPN